MNMHMKRYLMIICILSLFGFPATGFSKNSHYLKIIKKGEISVDFPGGTLDPGSGTSPSELTEKANTDNTIKILIARYRTANGDDKPLPYHNNNTNFIIDTINAIYNPETDIINIERIVQNVDSVNYRNYPSMKFIVQWYLLEEATIKTK